MIEYTVRVHGNGDKFWCLNGKLHREDGPAIEYGNGDKFWCLNDKLHREEGPAIEYVNGDKHWCLMVSCIEKMVQLLSMKVGLSFGT